MARNPSNLKIHITRLSIAEIPHTRPEFLEIGPKTVRILNILKIRKI